MRRTIIYGFNESYFVTYCCFHILIMLQVFAVEFVAFAIEFVGIAIEFVPFAIEFVGFAIEFVAFALQFVINKTAPRNQPVH